MQDKRNMLSYLLLLIFLINLTTLVINLEDHAPNIKLLKPEEKIGYHPLFSSSQGETGLENNAKGTSSEYQNGESLSLSTDQQSNNPNLGGPRTKTQSDYSALNWVDTRWRYRKNLTIDNTKVSADLTNFPMLVNLLDSNLRNDAQASGDDIFFTDESGNMLDHEIEYYNRVYNSTHAHLVAWVKTNLSNSQDTIISMYYGNPTVSNQENPTGVWNENFVLVQHLNDDPSGTIHDSSIYQHQGTQVGSMTSTNLVTGKITNAYYFNSGVGQAVNIPDHDSLDITENLTIEVWINVPAAVLSTGDYVILSHRDNDGYQVAFKDGALRMKILDAGSTKTVEILDPGMIANSWYHVVTRFEGPNMHIFINGTDVATNTGNDAITSYSTSFPLRIGARATGGNWFEGKIDEVRVSNTLRSNDWISTEFSNQNDPESFYSTGSKENSPASDNWPFPSLIYRKNITIDASKVSGSGNLTNFPVFVNLVDTDLQDTNKVQVDGNDILFTGKQEWIWSDELISNGNFETGSLAPWTTSGNWAVGTDPEFGDKNPQAGSYCAFITTNGLSSDYIQQDVDITSYSTYIDNGEAVANVSGWLVQAETGYDESRIRIQYLNSSKSIITTPLDTGMRSLTSWTRYSIDYNLIPANTRYIRVWATCHEEGWDAGSVDSFSVKIATLHQGSIEIKLDHEIEYFNQSTGQLIAWVRVPSLSGTSNTNITMYYGNDDLTSQENPSGVWNGYSGVWHLGESSGNALDSTYYGTSGTLSGGVTHKSTGQIGYSYGFDGLTGNVNFGDPSDSRFDVGTGSFTVSFWMISYSIGDWQFPIYKGASGTEDGYAFNVKDAPTDFDFDLSDGTNEVSTSSAYISFGIWNYIVAVVNSSDETLKVYNNGSQPVSTVDTTIGNTAHSADWIATEYNNQYDPVSFLSVGSEEIMTINWSIPSLRFRKIITIDSSKVNGSGSLTNFPVLVNLTDTDLQYASKVQVDGDDIVFTDASGTKLDHEIEYFNQSSGQLIAWVRVSSLSAMSNTYIAMYYGNEAVNSQENPYGVWDSNFVGVWHLSEDPTGTVYDSTSNDHDSTSYGSMTSVDQVTGQIDGSLDFDGTDDYIQWSSAITQTTGTYSFWLYTRNVTGERNIIAGNAFQNRLYLRDDRVRIETNTDAEYFDFTSSSIPTNTWTHVVIARAGDIGDLYVNGLWLQQVEVVGADIFTVNCIGGTDNLQRMLDGVIDEVRISNTARSADWIATGYNNQNDTSNFYSVDAEEVYNNWWADGSFSKRKDIVINRSKVSNDLNDFPILVDLHDTDLYDSQNIQVDGDDILFTDVNGTKLDHEIELFNQTFNTTHAHLVAWVRVPGLSSTEDTVISMYYGNNVLENQESPEGIWDSNYAGVWHLNEASGDTQDSTSYGTSGTVSGGITQGVDGQVDGAQEHDGIDSQVNFGDPVDGHLDFGTGNFSLSTWLYLSPTPLYIYPIYKGSHKDLTSGFCMYHRSQIDGTFVFSVGNGTLRYKTQSQFAISSNTWLHVVGVVDRGSNLIRLYLNGTEIATTDITGLGSIDSSLDLVFGRTGNPIDGFIDEFRLTNVALSADWIATEYNNQYDIGSFYSVGPENVYDETPPVVNEYGVDDPGTGTGKFWAIITDTASDVTSAKIRINSTEYSMSNNGTHWVYQQSVNLTDYYTYQITNASDVYGNNLTTTTSEKSYTFIQDSIAPTVVDWEYYAEQGPYGTFKANVSDSWGEIDTVMVNITNRVGKTAVMKNTTSGYINDTLVLTPGQINFTIIVNDTGGNTFTSTEHTGNVLSTNNVPVAGNLTLSRDQASVLLPVYSNSTLYLDYDYYDEDSDNETGTEIRWYKDGVLQAIHDDTTSVATTYLFDGDQWNATVKPKDGLEFGVLVASSLVTIQNSAPEVTTAVVSPGSPGTTTDLTATYNYFDTDGDSENVGNREIEWFKNGQPTAFTGPTLSSSNTAKGEDWSFKIRVHDGTQYSEWYQSANVTIINTAPTATSLNIVNAGNLRTNDDLVANWTFSDDDSDSQVDYYILWYKNSLLQPSLNNSMIITAGNTSKDQSWFFKLIVNDGTINSSADWDTALASATIQVLNSLPEASGLTITTIPYTIDNLVAGWNYNDADADGQSSYLLRWYKNGVLQPSLNDSTTVSSSLTSKGEEWNYTLQVNDGEDYSIVYNSSSVTILNSVPTTSGLTITTNPYNTTNLVVSWTFNDDDAGDSQAGYIIYWYRDGAMQSHLDNKTTVEAGNTTKGETWNYTAYVYDGESWSISYNSSTSTILNSKPTATGLNIENSGNLRTTDDLLANWTFSDLDADSQVAFYILWYKNGILQPLLNNTQTVAAGNTSKDQSWYFTLVVHDGEENSSLYTLSPPVQILNAAPTATGVTITANPNTTSQLEADWTFNDDDSGDVEISYLVRWYEGGILQPALNDSKTVSSSLTTKGEEWNFTLQVFDGEDYSIVYNSSTVTILNSPPTVSGLTITSNPYNITDLETSWTFVDDDSGDGQADYYIRWYKDKALQSQLDNKTTIGAANTTKGEQWNFTLQVFDGESWSIIYNSSIAEILNSAPTIIGSATFNKTISVLETDTLNITYSYYDPDFDSEVSPIIYWYKNNASGSYYIQSKDNHTILYSTDTSDGDFWYYKIRVNDGITYSNNYTSIGVPINFVNGKPEALNVQIISGLYTTDDLLGSYVYSDPTENHSEAGTLYAWYWFNSSSGKYELQHAYNDTLTLPAIATAKGDQWKFSVRPKDGLSYSVDWFNSSAVTILNTLPTASGLILTSNPYNTTNLVANWTFA
ncbi:MAG: DUF2341 domain-containing protein, partial [Candidatus Hodarchaeales archaeon]